jgi:AcrR family transcriptional regulator
MSTPAAARPSAAREKLVAAADELFYREGIHAVGVDRIIKEAGVTLATFYRHFAGKEALVEAYIGVEDAAIRGAFATAAEHADPDDPRAMVELVIEALADDVEHHHTRGCPFINAAVEYPDAASPIRRKVTEHRGWFRDTLVQVLTAAGMSDPDERAAALVLLRDAAMVGGYLDGADTVRPTFVRTARAAAGLD